MRIHVIRLCLRSLKNILIKYRELKRILRKYSKVIESKELLVVAKPRIELGTQGFSVLCSTD